MTYDKSPWMNFLSFPNNLELPKIIKNLGGKAWHVYRKDITKKMLRLHMMKISQLMFGQSIKNMTC